MKGIVLAGGSGTRLYPITLSVSKQLLPIYDKPMIYYPLSMLMLAGIKDILIISTETDLPRFKDLLGNGSRFGVKLSYIVQPSPDGLAQAFILGKDFIGDDNVAMVLGDNIFYGGGMRKRLLDATKRAEENRVATIFGYYVEDPERFGVAEFDDDFKVRSIEEKPMNPKSNYAVTGLYFLTNDAIRFAEEAKPSPRGELEITSVLNRYVENGNIEIEILGRGFTWFDTGTHDSLAEATEFVRMIEGHQGLQLSCLEEIGYINGWISSDELLDAAKKMGKSPYGLHLKRVAEGKIVH